MSRRPKPTPCMRVRIDAVVAFDPLLDVLPLGGQADTNKVAEGTKKRPNCIGRKAAP